MKIVISILGTVLDRRCGHGEKRWLAWRPSVALAMQKDLRFDRYYLLAEDKEKTLCETVARDIEFASPGTKVIAVPYNPRDPWGFADVYAALYDFSRQLNAKPDENEYYIHITTGTHVAQICLFLLTESRHFPGRLIQTSPSGSTIEGTHTVIDLDLSKYDQLAKRFTLARRDDVSFLKSGIDTKNAAFNALIEKIERVAVRSREPILLTGPTGAGKSQLARRIYELKKANHQIAGAFVDVNCATLRGDNAMSTLFGHEKGAFTGAVKARPGLLKTADKGILFLDEIGELGADEQAMLLRAIEEKRFLPLGSDTETDSDFQLICGTNRNLEEAVASGKFRDDLLERINLWRFALPGLAERREDIEPNLDYELERFSEANNIRVTFNTEARQAFLTYACSPATLWKGNFRELNAMMKRLATLAPEGRIDLATVNAEITSAQTRTVLPAEQSLPPFAASFTEQYDRFDLSQLSDVLKVCSRCSSLAEAARILFAVSRKTKKSANDSDRLAKYLRRFGLSAEKVLS